MLLFDAKKLRKGLKKFIFAEVSRLSFLERRSDKQTPCYAIADSGI
jgi:hypothetical protein